MNWMSGVQRFGRRSRRKATEAVSEVAPMAISGTGLRERNEAYYARIEP